MGAGVAVATALVAASVASAVPVTASPSGPNTTRPSASAATASAAGSAASTDFSGIVSLDNCSGSIVRWSASKPSDKAMVLTGGYCTRSYKSGEVDVNVPLVRSVTLLNADGSDEATVSTTTLLYGTMHRTDVSLYQLGLTYAQLSSQYGVPALTVSPHQAGPKDAIVIISGYWKTAYSCQINGFVYRLKESVWTWDHSLRFGDAGCDLIHGTAGSPVLDPKTRAVVGIHNTTNDHGQTCTRNNPCEVDRAGHVTVHKHRSYGQQTWWFTTCLGADRSLDLAKPGCLLPAP